MLSQYDRQQLEMIASRLRMDDPDLAKALRDGKPRPNPPNRRWPFVLLGVLAGLVFVAGVLVASFVFMFAGALAMSLIVVSYRKFGRKAPRVQVSRRRPQPY
ncbi:MAG TPA: DUF3040 domain-containing protein [Actinophytocola sp.]|uniref:DUF3040 domain-containing protein n=1 Tax=Actinophytocola sp. TaxID=1872138 RepID=UPI002DBCEC98|nr:DUF3040 domain-containing protein [Actinophytocola sp.]HEU5475357.1 DUF3040 domain-containing protein [Actinophytocola sp.]